MVLKLFSESLYSILPVKWYENLPNVILESFSVGTPVIATDIGSIRYVIEHNRNGYLFEYGNYYDLKRKLTEGLEITVESYGKMQSECLNDISINYSENNHYNKLIKIFKEVGD